MGYRIAYRLFMSAKPAEKSAASPVPATVPEVAPDRDPAPEATNPSSSRRRRLAGVAVYATAALLSLVLGFAMLELWDADMRVPFTYRDDAIVQALTFKSTIENGWYLSIPQVGAPGHLKLYDFPCGDTLHLLGVKAMALFSHDWALLFNVYFLLGFPLITCAALAVFRHFRVPLAPALAGAILYAFLPSRLMKGQGHIFLDVFYQVPLAMLVALWVCGADPPLTRDRGPGRWPGLEIRRAQSILALVLCVIAGLGGFYYSFFAAFLIGVGGLWASADRRSWRNLVSGLMLSGLMLGTVVLNSLPSLTYTARHGKNLAVANRTPGEAEIFGLKIIQLLLPVPEHRLPAWRAFSHDYRTSAPLVNENNFVSLGVMGSLGFLALLGWVMLRARADNPRGDLRRSLAVLNLSALLLGTLGGFGALFARLISPQVRTYCRINVIIGFLALFAFVLLLERVGRRRRWLGAVAAAIALAAGLFDQVTPAAMRAYADVKTEYQNDDRFVRDIEASLPRNAMVFELPFLPFPEIKPPGQMAPYDPLRGYIHSRTLRWSYPVMRGRADDIWTSSVSAEKPARIVDELGVVGFGGILIDRNGYADRGAALEGALAHILEEQPYVNPSQEMSFFNLEPYKARQKVLTPAEHERQRDAVLHPLLLHWVSGCYEAEPGPQGEFRWCPATAQLDVENSARSDKTAQLSMVLVPGTQPGRITLEGDLLSEAIVVTETTSFQRTLEIPPGTHSLRFRAEGRPVDAPLDPRTLIFRVENPALLDTSRP